MVGDHCSGESALIHGTRYVYDTRTAGSGVQMDPILKEAHYSIECPKCGKRTQIIKLG